jgi:transglutaminase-like putative cysteine protease
MRAGVRFGIAIAVACILASFTLAPLTQDPSFLGPSWLLIIVICAIGVLARRTRLGSGGALAGQVLALLGFLYLVSKRLTANLPGTEEYDFLDRMAYLLNEAGIHVQSEAAPMPPDDGVKLLFIGSIGVITILTDVLVVSLRRPVLGLAPPLTVFLVPAIGLATDTGWWPFLCLAVGYLGILIADGLNTSARWTRGLSADSAAGSMAGEAGVVVWRAATYLAAPALVFALIGSAALPTLAVGSWGFGEGSGSGGPLRLSDPTLDLKRNLTLPQNKVVLTYRTNKPTGSYLRMASLPAFSQAGWQNAQTSIEQGDRLPQPPGLTEATGKNRRTTIKIQDFASEYLPLPFAPVSFDARGSWGYDPQSLVVISSDRRGDRDNATQGLEYSVTSRDVNPDPRSLEQSLVGNPPDVDITTALPQDLPKNIISLARRITRDASSPAAKAAAIQSYLRNPDNFTYSTDPRPGSGYQALENFLFRDKHGYCEQFAASMAVMARAVGIPSRVAVGFLPGTKHGDVWTVTARDSHAWPELYYSGYGWVRYEPTPSTVTGAAPTWSVPRAETPDELPSSNPEPTQSAATARPTLRPDQEQQQGHVAGTAADQGVNWGVVAGVGGGVVLLLTALATPGTVRLTRRRTRLGGSFTDPADRVEAGWSEVRDTVRDLARNWPAGSPRSIAATVGRHTDAATQDALRKLALLVERGRYARAFGDTAGAASVAGLVRTIRHGLLADRSTRSRLAMTLAPRSVLRRPGR